MNNFELNFNAITLIDIGRKESINKACYRALNVPNINDVIYVNNIYYFVDRKVFDFDDGVIVLYVKELDKK